MAQNPKVTDYAAIVRLIHGGKRVGAAIYLHVTLLGEQPSAVRAVITTASWMAETHVYSVVRFTVDRPEVALLDYPGFFQEPFPVLHRSWLINFDTARVKMSQFSTQENPPILHRKELFLSSTHQDRRRFERLTNQLESHHAFAYANRIGRRSGWHETLRSLGLRVSDHQVYRTQGIRDDGSKRLSS